MSRTVACCLFIVVAATHGALAQQSQRDTISTSSGELVIGVVGHGSLMFRHGGHVIHVDPVMREADYATMLKADLILVTHSHGDHLDPQAIEHIRTAATSVVVAPDCRDRVESAIVMENGTTRTVTGLRVEAVPAYNVVHKRDGGNPYHRKGDGNGYVITFGDKRIYVAGDSENVPEMKALTDIDVAFLPMNVPYTMTPAMVADAAKAFRPKVLYPYHYGNTDTQELIRLLGDETGIEVRIRE